MTTRPLGFRRLVLGLQPGAPDHAAELAVEFAQLLDRTSENNERN